MISKITFMLDTWENKCYGHSKIFKPSLSRMLIKYIKYPRLNTQLKKGWYVFCPTKDEKLRQMIFGVLR